MNVPITCHPCMECGKVFTIPDHSRNNHVCPFCRNDILQKELQEVKEELIKVKIETNYNLQKNIGERYLKANKKEIKISKDNI